MHCLSDPLPALPTPCAPPGRWLNWTIVAPLSLNAIFQGSTWLTEKISLSKYGAK